MTEYQRGLEAHERAVEHGRYLADAAEQFMKEVNKFNMKRDSEGIDVADIDSLTDHWEALDARIHDFRKRAAAIRGLTPQPEMCPNCESTVKKDVYFVCRETPHAWHVEDSVEVPQPAKQTPKFCGKCRGAQNYAAIATGRYPCPNGCEGWPATPPTPPTPPTPQPEIDELAEHTVIVKLYREARHPNPNGAFKPMQEILREYAGRAGVPVEPHPTKEKS